MIGKGKRLEFTLTISRYFTDKKQGNSSILVQSPCAQHFEKPNLKISEFGVRKGLLIEKMPNERTGALVFKSIFQKYRVQACFMPREGEMGGARDN